LQQAAITNPAIMQDPRVQKANAAVGDCADGIAQMANSELPKPKKTESKQEEKRTTKSLVESVEEGMESAAKEIKGQHQQKDEQAQKNAQQQQQARANAEGAREARRRLRREQAAARAAANKVVATPPPKPIKIQETKIPSSGHQKSGIAGLNLNMEALAAVRQAGVALKNSNSQAKNLLAENAKMAVQSAETKRSNLDKPTNVSVGDKIAPDDKNFAQREQDQKNNPKNRPRIV